MENWNAVAVQQKHDILYGMKKDQRPQSDNAIPDSRVGEAEYACLDHEENSVNDRDVAENQPADVSEAEEYRNNDTRPPASE